MFENHQKNHLGEWEDETPKAWNWFAHFFVDPGDVETLVMEVKLDIVGVEYFLSQRNISWSEYFAGNGWKA